MKTSSVFLSSSFLFHLSSSSSFHLLFLLLFLSFLLFFASSNRLRENIPFGMHSNSTELPPVLCNVICADIYNIWYLHASILHVYRSVVSVYILETYPFNACARYPVLGRILFVGEGAVACAGGVKQLLIFLADCNSVNVLFCWSWDIFEYSKPAARSPKVFKAMVYPKRDVFDTGNNVSQSKSISQNSHSKPSSNNFLLVSLF